MNLENKLCPYCNAPLSLSLIKNDNGEEVCQYCGHKIDSISEDEDLNNEIQKASALRNEGNFKEASERFQMLLKKHSDNYLIRWEILLCKYGVVYAERKDDLVLERRITCWEKVDSSILDESNYHIILKNVDGNERAQYIKDASTIAEIQRKINAVNKMDYDIFICYKETTNKGERTLDSHDANVLYEILRAENYKVFFARETLRNMAGSDYEAAIFNAVSSSKIMIAFGSSKEYLESPWVKNEWSRFLYSMKKERRKKLIPMYKDNIDNLPKQFKEEHLQGIDMSNITSLLENVHKIIPKLDNQIQEKNESFSEKVKEGETLLSKGNLEKAFECFSIAAQKGNTEACYYVGVDLYTSENADSREAFKWFEKAAKGGLVQAQEQLAFMYEFGEGVEKNKSIADQWRKRASESGER